MSWRSLRVRLAVLGFLAIYLPVLLLLGVTVVAETDTATSIDDGADEVEVNVVENTAPDRSPWVIWTVVVLGPVAAGLAWWWSGRAVRPIDRVRSVAEDIEGEDLSRRIALETGPTEIVSLAASFDAMLDRLERAAETQRHLIEETSHELRTPLSVLSTNADVLLAHPNPTVDVYREGLERSKSAATRLQRTIDELLVDARGRARTIDREPADLVAIVQSVVDEAGAVAQQDGVELTTSGPPTAVCSLDEATVTRAVSNLVDNAIRYRSGGSTVEVDVVVTDSEAKVVVTDHGPGIPSEEQAHIFERFWRGNNDTQGTGLGLPIANQIALAHGGSLTVLSPGPTGDGCVFTLALRR